MSWRVALSGLVLLAAPGLLAAELVPAPAAREWARSPRGLPQARPAPAARWDEPARASLALLRRVSIAEAHRSAAALSACEAQAEHAAAGVRAQRYRACARSPLQRTNGFGLANSRMLAALAENGGPTRACRQRVLSLSGITRTIGFSAGMALRLDTTWPELRAGSRAMREALHDELRYARRPGWGRTCRPRPPVAAEPPPSA